jgi:putative hydrolase of the HAD superfamily
MDSTPLVEIVKQKRAVVFDLFHTLVALDSRPGREQQQLHEILGVSREAFAKQLMLTSHDRLVGNKTDAFAIVSEIAHAIDATISDAAIRRAAAHLIEVFSAALREIPENVVSVLTSLRAMGKCLGLVSNASAMEVTGWSRSPIAPLFDSVVFSCFCGSVKPEERIYHLCTDELGVTPEECLFVGDGESNELEGAQRIGMTSVMTTEFIGRTGVAVIEERRRYADFTISWLNELVELQQPGG